MKEGGPNFWGRPILQNVSIIWSPLLYFNFKTFLDANSSTFIRFQSFLLQSGVLFSGPRNFCKLKWRDLISRRNRLCRMSQLYGPLFCISILKVLSTYIIPHSLDFTHFYMNHGYFSQSPEISEK